MNKINNKVRLKNLLALFLIILLHHSIGWCRASRSNLEDRLENLENKLNSNFNLEIANKLEELQKEVQELRGMLEEQRHAKLSLKDDKQLTIESEQHSYNTAYKLVEDKNFAEAILAFKDFLHQYDSGQYAPNAKYWLGELYLTEHQFSLAADYFLQVANKHKEHPKAPDALLKLGMLELERENWQDAKNYFNQIKQNYANSPRVHMADAKLQSMEREGH